MTLAQANKSLGGVKAKMKIRNKRIRASVDDDYEDYINSLDRQHEKDLIATFKERGGKEFCNKAESALEDAFGKNAISGLKIRKVSLDSAKRTATNNGARMSFDLFGSMQIEVPSGTGAEVIKDASYDFSDECSDDGHLVYEGYTPFSWEEEAKAIALYNDLDIDDPEVERIQSNNVISETRVVAGSIDKVKLIKDGKGVEIYELDIWMGVDFTFEF